MSQETPVPMKSLFRLALVLLALPAGAFAQVGVYGAFSTASLDTLSSRINGGTVGLQYDGRHHPLVNFGLDLRGTVLTGDSDSRTTQVVGGPRIVLHLPVVPLHPYAEALVGGASVKFGQGSATTSTGSVAGGFALGTDLHILPFIDWRVIDYNYTRLVEAHAGQSSFSTGIVIRIPFS